MHGYLAYIASLWVRNFDRLVYGAWLRGLINYDALSLTLSLVLSLVSGIGTYFVN